MEVSTIEMRDVTAERAPPYRKEQPPSYDLFYGKIKHARNISDGKVDFLKKVMKIICTPVAPIVGTGVALAIPIACVVIGVRFLDDCPLKSFIPIFLVVSGSVVLLPMVLVIFLTCIDIFVPDQDEKNSCCYTWFTVSVSWEFVFLCFLMFISGNVWDYTRYDDFSTNSTSENYCHPTVYYFSSGFSHPHPY